jgi:hypothetical protein
MGIFNKVTDTKRILQTIGYFLFKIYKSNKKEVDVPKPLPLFLPLLPLISPQNILYSNMLLTYALMSGLTILMVKDLIDSSNGIKNLLDSSNGIKNLLELSNKNEFLPKLPLNITFPEKRQKKRILPLHVCCSYSINQYVIFTRKNKNNPSCVNINCGEIGQVIKRLDGLERALVDFDIEVPSRFEKFNTKSIAEKALNEGIVIFEESHLKN